MNKLIDNFLKMTLWIWLPFAALIRLTQDVISKHDHE